MCDLFELLVTKELKTLEDVECITEAVAKKTRRVRKGKVVRIRKCAHGFKKKGTRCVRQQSRERIVRTKAGRKAARKGKASRKRNFSKSTKIRQRRNLKRQKF